MKFCRFVFKILSGNELLAQINGHNSSTNLGTMMCLYPKLDLVNISNLVKFCQFVLEILSRNEIQTYIKGQYSSTDLRKCMCNNPKVDLVNMNAYITFGDILSICSQNIERK